MHSYQNVLTELDLVCQRNNLNKENVEAIPEIAQVEKALELIRSIIFPEFSNKGHLDMSAELAQFVEIMEVEICKSLNLKPEMKNLEKVERRKDAKKILNDYLSQLPEILELLLGDLEAIYEGDPAAESRMEIAISYLSYQAIVIYRLAHPFYEAGVPIIPKLMSEYAHKITGIDIHPGAQIGKNFFIDHGTGIVIGKTTVIGDNVKIYQGVTLGALSLKEGRELREVKRHPTIGNKVVIYANATILGGDTVIGDGVIIGGGTFITKSVEENTQVYLDAKKLPIKSRK